MQEFSAGGGSPVAGVPGGAGEERTPWRGQFPRDYGSAMSHSHFESRTPQVMKNRIHANANTLLHSKKNQN